MSGTLAEVVEVFSKYLPVQVIVQMKTHLGPAWNEILSTSSFIKKHRLQMKAQSQYKFYFTPPPLMPRYVDQGERKLSLIRDRLPGIEGRDVVCSSYGLMCYANSANEFFLWNPMTDQSDQVPYEGFEWPDNVVEGTLMFGMGYNKATDDYKLVRIAVYDTFLLDDYDEEFITEVKVYSRNNRAWTRAGNFPFEMPQLTPGVFVNGHIHWIINGMEKTSIAAYSIADGQYKEIELGGMQYSHQFVHRITCLDEETLVLYPSNNRSDEQVMLWMLRDYANPISWSRIDIMVDEGMHWLPWGFCFQPLKFLKPDLTRILFRVDPGGTFIVYDIIHRTFEVVNFEQPTEGFCNFVKHIETFEEPGQAE